MRRYLRPDLPTEVQNELVLLAEQVTSVLEQLICGRTVGPWQCCCGTIKRGESVAVSVSPPPIQYIQQYAGHLTWSVHMKDMTKDDSTDFHWACGVSRFLSGEQLTEIFNPFDQIVEQWGSD